ncbi:4-hydroxybenzoate octaprenyltransferase [Halothermothrix orenii]|uniref:4-hydroxybenzoate polyprenyltransferase n=1 Tax=Halothermothrix orenii (strain H 168 / OCM 544 / DSM 9562) TaxID=373903 RepID=B8CY61_HALOH|nr:4-hydroxybenzoate octaprenyltransferase [Halothermothrix orenii]ACL70230.1 4-hydroxybenzoate polyprenyltransferase [Halothermothrix orenii H 168]
MELIYKKVKTYADLVMFEHTIFALPFAYLSLFLALGGKIDLSYFFWVTVAMIGARNGANAWNRLADMDIDKKNPRTADRHLPRGEVSPREVVFLTVFCFTLLILAAFNLHPICLKLLPLAVIIVIFYSYTKRFTWACHLFLGFSVALAPLGAWLAVRGGLAPGVIILAMVQALWVAGFDIIYATQDYQFDTTEGVYSIPARFGVSGGLKIARLLHFLAFLLLVILPCFFPLGLIYYLGLVIIGGLLIYQHRLVSPDDLSRVNKASYNVNEIIGPVLLLASVLDILLF